MIGLQDGQMAPKALNTNRAVEDDARIDGEAKTMRRLAISLLTLVLIGIGAVGLFELAPALPGFWAQDADTQSRLVTQAAAQETTQPMPATTTTTKTTHGGWTVTCTEAGDPPKRTCTATFQVVNKQNRQTLLAWVFGRNQKGDLLAEFMTPTDVQIGPGVSITLDGAKPVKANFVECTTRGCKARLELPAAMVRQMKAGKKARIDLTRIDGQVIQFSMEVNGIAEALGELGA